MGQHEQAEKNRSRHEQDRLDDLHPGRREHPAEDDVDNHEHADADDRGLVADVRTAEQQRDERAGADHLRDHVKGADRERAQRGHRADRPRIQSIGEHVRHRVFAGVAQRFGDDEQHGQIRDQPADRKHEAVVAVERDHARDAEKRGRAHVIARDGDAVLPAGDPPARGEEGRGALRSARRPVGDPERDQHEEQEHSERWCHDFLLLLVLMLVICSMLQIDCD